MSIEVSPALDYSPKEISSGSYVLRLVSPENGQPTLALNSTVNTDFLLPNQVINLARSQLFFNLTLATAAGNFQAAHNGFLAPIDGIVLSTASGVRLVEMNNLPEYTKIAWRPQTNFEDFVSYPCHQNSTGANAGLCTTVTVCAETGQLFNKTRALAAANSDVNGAFHISAEDGKSVAAVDEDYVDVSNFVGQYAAGALALRVALPLKMIYGCLLAVDKDLYFGEQLRLTIRWNQGVKFGWRQANHLYDVTAASLDLAALPTLTSVALRVAVETNDAVAQGLKSRVMNEGINMNIPFTYVYKAVGSATADVTNTVIRKLNRGHGAKLLRILAGIYSSSQAGALYCNNFNWATSADGIVAPVPPKWVSYRTMLDSKPIQDDTLSMLDNTAYAWNAEKFKGSLIKSTRSFAMCPTIIEDFSGVPRSRDWPENDTANSGLDLSTEREFSLQFTNSSGNATALNVYLFAVCQKKLSINKDGIQLM